jgi:hypothetical protein
VAAPGSASATAGSRTCRAAAWCAVVLGRSCSDCSMQPCAEETSSSAPMHCTAACATAWSPSHSSPPSLLRQEISMTLCSSRAPIRPERGRCTCIFPRVPAARQSSAPVRHTARWGSGCATRTGRLGVRTLVRHPLAPTALPDQHGCDALPLRHTGETAPHEACCT